eukprot:scaffold876_cov243-Pinguiococcus_pyrenoidosus.AAC.37
MGREEPKASYAARFAHLRQRPGEREARLLARRCHSRVPQISRVASSPRVSRARRGVFRSCRGGRRGPSLLRAHWDAHGPGDQVNGVVVLDVVGRQRVGVVLQHSAAVDEPLAGLFNIRGGAYARLELSDGHVLRDGHRVVTAVRAPDPHHDILLRGHVFRTHDGVHNLPAHGRPPKTPEDKRRKTEDRRQAWSSFRRLLKPLPQTAIPTRVAPRTAEGTNSLRLPPQTAGAEATDLLRPCARIPSLRSGQQLVPPSRTLPGPRAHPVRRATSRKFRGLPQVADTGLVGASGVCGRAAPRTSPLRDEVRPGARAATERGAGRKAGGHDARTASSASEAAPVLSPPVGCEDSGAVAVLKHSADNGICNSGRNGRQGLVAYGLRYRRADSVFFLKWIGTLAAAETQRD